MDGTETFGALRQINANAKILIVSGLPEVSGARDLLARGAVGFLQKPYDAPTLEGTIRRVLVS
jgi:two-component system chemotaxis response regulator CheY